MMGDDRRKAENAIIALNPNRVYRVYSGLPGCGCGCKGVYYEDKRNVKRVVTAMQKAVLDQDSRIMRVEADPNTLEHPNWVYAVEMDNRYYWAYGSGPVTPVTPQHGAQ